MYLLSLQNHTSNILDHDTHDSHGHHPAPEEPKTFADYVKPEYWYR